VSNRQSCNSSRGSQRILASTCPLLSCHSERYIIVQCKEIYELYEAFNNTIDLLISEVMSDSTVVMVNMSLFSFLNRADTLASRNMKNRTATA
jgi:hypothetical protein